MFRITRIVLSSGVMLRLEGKLMGPWVEALRQAGDDRAVVQLDLLDVDYADHEGLRLLQSLRQRGVKLHSCSIFIKELLKREDQP